MSPINDNDVICGPGWPLQANRRLPSLRADRAPCVGRNPTHGLLQRMNMQRFIQYIRHPLIEAFTFRQRSRRNLGVQFG